MLRRFTRRCAHKSWIRDVTPSADGCEEHLQMGDAWVHLRECLTCGHVGSSVSLRERNTLSVRAILDPDGAATVRLIA